MKVFVSVGTRPEAIKLAPVISALNAQPGTATTVCLTGQHADLAREALGEFGLRADIALRVPEGAIPLSDRFGHLVSVIGEELAREDYSWVVVHGDTASTFAGALAAFHAHRPVAHVEAGLRTGDITRPWPEEGYRRMTAVVTRAHFAPTQRAYGNLLAEGTDPSGLYLTGNTVVDALLDMRQRIMGDAAERGRLAAWHDEVTGGRPSVLVTAHRRENHGAAMKDIAEAVAILAEARPDHAFILPVHPNPEVSRTIRATLGQKPNVTLTEPLAYRKFIYLMMTARLILSDSGGIQEEAPTFGVPVLVLRNESERPEAIEAGVAKLVGTNRARIVSQSLKILDGPDPRAASGDAHSPFGDGKAAERIAKHLAEDYRMRVLRETAVTPEAQTAAPVAPWVVSKGGIMQSPLQKNRAGWGGH